MGEARSALDLIGNTPLVRLRRMHDGLGEILAKAEFLQPGGSVKDRAAAAIVGAAYDRGELQPGQPVVEMSSGNMGAGLAVVCAVTGNPLVITMSRGNSPARARMMEQLGAEVILVPQVDGSPGKVTGADIAAAAERAKAIAAERGGFYVDQFGNTDGVDAHEQGTGPELWRDAEGRLDGFVTAVGSAGTFVGVARFLARTGAEVLCAAVEPVGAAVLAGRPVIEPRHLLQGAGYGSVPPHWDPSLVDAFVAVSDEEAADTRARLAQREGLHVGYTAAANVAAAIRLFTEGHVPADGRVATVLCDTGLKY